MGDTHPSVYPRRVGVGDVAVAPLDPFEPLDVERCQARYVGSLYETLLQRRLQQPRDGGGGSGCVGLEVGEEVLPCDAAQLLQQL